MRYTLMRHCAARVTAPLLSIFMGSLAWFAPASALAADATVHTKNGGLVRGELMEVQPNVMIRLRMSDGQVREIPWNDVSSLDDGAPAPPPAAGAAALGSHAAASGEDRRELLELEQERAEISDTGPAVMMIVGGGAFLLFTPIGLGLFAVQSACKNDGALATDCPNVGGAALTFTLLGAAGGVAAVWGFIKALNNGNRREAIDLRMRDLRGSQAALSLDLLPRPGGGQLALSVRF